MGSRLPAASPILPWIRWSLPPCCSPPPAMPAGTRRSSAASTRSPTTVAIAVGLQRRVARTAACRSSGLPAAAAWPWVIASVLIHLVYFAGADRELSRRRHGAGLSDRARLGPAAHGGGKRRCCSASTSRSLAWLGIVLLAGGVILMSLRGGRDLAQLDRRAVGFALFTAVTICAYSLVDGMGARTVGQCPRLYGRDVPRQRHRHGGLCAGSRRTGGTCGR